MGADVGCNKASFWNPKVNMLVARIVRNQMPDFDDEKYDANTNMYILSNVISLDVICIL